VVGTQLSVGSGIQKSFVGIVKFTWSVLKYIKTATLP
jgi:hypothetical protein